MTDWVKTVDRRKTGLFTCLYSKQTVAFGYNQTIRQATALMGVL
jgi:hypothetical protein